MTYMVATVPLYIKELGGKLIREPSILLWDQENQSFITMTLFGYKIAMLYYAIIKSYSLITAILVKNIVVEEITF